MMRLGHYRPVHVKNRGGAAPSHDADRAKGVRGPHAGHRADDPRLLKVYGFKLGQVHRCNFAAKVQALLENKPELWVAIDPLLETRNVMRRQHVVLDRHLSQVARKEVVCRRLMTLSGVGPIVSLAFKAPSTIPRASRTQRQS
jgi:transposase